jgi:hypothetical protein
VWTATETAPVTAMSGGLTPTRRIRTAGPEPSRSSIPGGGRPAPGAYGGASQTFSYHLSYEIFAGCGGRATGIATPSAPRLGPSIVNERGDEAPRIEAGAPHSPVSLLSGGDFASCKDLFAPRSLLFEPHSLLFEPHSPLFASRSPAFESFEGEGKRRELHVERREELFEGHSTAFKSPQEPFASHSPEFERREEERTRLEEWGMPREEEGTWHFKLFARHSLLIAYHSLRGMSLELSFGRLEERGMPRKVQQPSRKHIPKPLSALQASFQRPLSYCQAGDRLLEEDLTGWILFSILHPLQPPSLGSPSKSTESEAPGLPGIVRPLAGREERHPRASGSHQARHV